MKAREFFFLKKALLTCAGAIGFYYIVVRYVHKLIRSQPGYTSFPISGDSATKIISLQYQNSFPLTTIRRPQLLNSPPQAGYPTYTSLLDTISTWNPDNPDPPAVFTETLQHFNYSDTVERSYAQKFRDAEIPFKLYGVPEILHVVNKWDDNYLADKMKYESSRVEESKSNHFMFWNIMRDRTGGAFVPPTDLVSMPFIDWLEIAKKADIQKVKSNSTHYYFMTGTSAEDNLQSYVSRDLQFFSTRENNFFITNVEANKGIQCRFGMRGIIAEAHYDSGRNMVAMLKGAKRYIIIPPRECKKLGIITDQKHPSFRHSSIDWSDINEAIEHDFASVDAIDTIVQTGEVLYIPSYWFHYIVSLKYSIQCNSRSGSPPNREGQADIDECLGKQKMWTMANQKKKLRGKGKHP